MPVDWKTRIYDDYVSSGSSRLTLNDVGGSLRKKQRNLRRLCERHFPSDRNARIVDFGCGYGALVDVLKKRGYGNVEGVDVSPAMVAVARSLGLEEVRLGTLSDYLHSVADGKLDVAVFMDVLEHLTRAELFETLDEVARVLRRKGCLIGRVPNGQGIFGPTIRYGDVTHELAYTPQSMRQCLHAAGFENVRCYEEEIVVHGAVSAVRKLVWKLGTVPMRMLYAAETGNKRIVLTSNMLFVAERA
ncbi:MAG: class I SAM-dependent methyltransferase [Armatimonadetes bacterium]|nr:class I SAM-dependent methyltransferase [Armatimonadota bacterium]